MSVARVYAKALFEAAKEAGESGEGLVKIENELASMSAAVESSNDAMRFLYGPIGTAKEKQTVLEAVAKKLSTSRLTLEFLNLLATKGRLGILSDVRGEFAQVRLRAEGGVPGVVVSAEPLNPADVESLASAFTKKLGKKVSFSVSTDPNLLAGMKVTVNGVTYDGSLRSQLQQLRDRVLSAHAASTEQKTNH
jgi:F-type H+-transporting ATPase subunit delta